MDRLPWGEDQRAVASNVVTFLVAGAIFVVAVGGILLAGREGGKGTVAAEAPVANLNHRADSLAGLLVGSPGYAATGSDWATSPTVVGYGSRTAADGLTRLGLQDAGSIDRSVVDFEKFQNLRMAPYDANATDGYVNYPEARASLGLDQAGLDFHLRAYPSLKRVQEMLDEGYRDPNLRVTYLGDVTVSQSNGQPPPSDPTEGFIVSPPTCAVSPLTSSPNPQAYRLSVQVTNGGSVATQFNALFEYELGDTDQASQNSNTYLVQPNQTATLFVDVPASREKHGNAWYTRSCAVGSEIEVDVHDPGTTHVEVEVELATAVTGAVTAPVDLWLDTRKPYFVNANGATSGCPDPVKLNYGGKDLEKDEWMAVKVVDGGGAQVTIPASVASFQVPNSGNPPSLNVGCLVAGDYTATMHHCGSKTTPCSPSAALEQVVERVLVATAAPSLYSPPSAPPPQGPVTYTPATSTVEEVRFLEYLVEKFCPTYFDSASNAPITVDWAARCEPFKGGQAQPGDVFPDSKDVMNNELPKRLVTDPGDCDSAPRYDVTNVLVAGSNLDQNAMTSAAAKKCVATWVLGGGTLIAFGSAAQNVNWLEPIFHAAIVSSSDGLGVPDPGHPVLHTADELDYPHYDHRDRVWNFNGQTAQNAAQLFTDVVVQGSDPVTTISNPGSMGAGSVLLTTWTPYDVFNGTRDPTTTASEGRMLVNNLLMQGYRDLFLDYGPDLPPNTNVIPSKRLVQLRHPDFDELIQINLLVYVFAG